MIPCYDREGRPITLEEWVTLTERGNDYRQVARTVIGDVAVSTVWLGLNQNMDLKGIPLIFATMVYGGPLTNATWRYATELEALAGHEDIVALVRAQEQP